MLSVGLKPEEEKVLDVTSTKKFIEVYLQEKIRNQALAYSTLSLSVGRLNRTTLCWSVIFEFSISFCLISNL